MTYHLPVTSKQTICLIYAWNLFNWNIFWFRYRTENGRILLEELGRGKYQFVLFKESSSSQYRFIRVQEATGIGIYFNCWEIVQVSQPAPYQGRRWQQTWIWQLRGQSPWGPAKHSRWYPSMWVSHGDTVWRQLISGQITREGWSEMLRPQGWDWVKGTVSHLGCWSRGYILWGHCKMKVVIFLVWEWLSEPGMSS